MGRLIASTLCSVDLRISDDAGRFDWAEPTEELHAFANELQRPVGTALYGRRMWETMRFWQTMPDEDSVMGEYGRLWRAADKVVHSSTLEGLDVPRTRLERTFDPEVVRARVSVSAADVSIGGATLAGRALTAGIVDELQLILAPIVIGEGPRALPEGMRAELTLLETRVFGGGWTFLRYRVR